MNSAAPKTDLNHALFECITGAHQQTALIVPTRSLANILAEEYAAQQLVQGHTAWVKPAILTWADLQQDLWQINRRLCAELAPLTPITKTQSLVLWTRVLDAAKRAEDELTLMNVAQSAIAAQSAYTACQDWGLQDDTLALYKNLDLDQFQTWKQAYESACADASFLDSACMSARLASCQNLKSSYQRFVFYAFDLLSVSQQQLIQTLQSSGLKVLFRGTGYESEFVGQWEHVSSRAGKPAHALGAVHSYNYEADELATTLETAFQLLEKSPELKIGIVVPDLQNRRAQVARFARERFYPSLTPLQAENHAGAYRISLGKPLYDWSAIYTVLVLASILTRKVALRDLANVLRSQHVFAFSAHNRVVNSFLQWLAEARIHTITLTDMPELLARYLAYVSAGKAASLGSQAQQTKAATKFCDKFNQLLSLRDELLASVEQSGKYSTQSPQAWKSLFEAWFDGWGWSCGRYGQDLTSEQYQLDKKFASTLESFANLDLVLNKCGLKRALDLLTTLCQESVFSPQAEPAPILISGMYEAVGRQVDHLFILGAHEDFMSSLPTVPFIPASALLSTHYPSANYERHFAQMQAVLNSLMLSATNVTVSFARRDLANPDTHRTVTPLLRRLKIEEQDSLRRQPVLHELEEYSDDHGQPYPRGTPIAHGMAVFKDQSSCPFKAFATHRLNCFEVDEPEFGLEPSAQGTLLHALLEIIWGHLRNKNGLVNWLAKPMADQSADINRWVGEAIESCQEWFNAEQQLLAQRERNRYEPIVREWLQLEAQRPLDFTVVEKEWKFSATLGGIPYRGKVDRIDHTGDQRALIIDYKSGSVDRNDWQGDRLVNPQMPLYLMAYEQVGGRLANGIAYAKVRRTECDFSYMGEDGILKKPSYHTEKYAKEWQAQSLRWKPMLEALAEEFLQGQARVDPVDKACQYCPYDGLCRVKQLSSKHLGVDAQELLAEWGPQGD